MIPSDGVKMICHNDMVYQSENYHDIDITILRQKEGSSFTGESYVTKRISENPVTLLPVRMWMSGYSIFHLAAA